MKWGEGSSENAAANVQPRSPPRTANEGERRTSKAFTAKVAKSAKYGELHTREKEAGSRGTRHSLLERTAAIR
jgi:hypothetical protein